MSQLIWPEAPLRHLATIPIANGLGASGDSGNPLEWPRYIRTTDIKNLFELHDDRRVTLPVDVAQGALVDREDILMTAAGATVGKSFQYCETAPACFAGYLVRWRVDRALAVPRFMAYWTESQHYWDQIAVGAVKSTIENFSASKYRAMRAPVPPLAEQRAIADFLDRETQQIDELIAEQRGLIETLRERRRAVTESAVFGMERDGERVARSESWLPNLPVSWQAMQLGFVTESQPGYAFASDGFKYDDTGIRLLRGINVKPGGVDWTERVTWDEETTPVTHDYSLESGDVVFGMDRPFVEAGVRVAVITEEDLPALLVQRVLRIRATGRMANRYLRYLIGTSALQFYLEPMFTGVSVPHISDWQVRKFVVPVPPVDEQKRIADYLDDQTARIDALIAESEDLIALSLERRAALITAAVTGQIRIGADGRQVRVTEAA